MYTSLLHVVLLAASSLSASVVQNVVDSCSEDQTKCDDGSCISIVGKWNSSIKCQHSSAPHTSRRKSRQAQKGMCVLPEYPANGTYITNIPNAKIGDAYDSVTINVTCDRGFALNGSATTYCYNGWWSEPMPKCVSAQCYLPSHPSVIYRCLVFGRVESSRACGKYESNGTVVSPQCRSLYYYSATVLTRMLCIDGNWNYTAKCSPECGKISSSGTPFVTGGESAKRSEVPWHAGIYTKTTDSYKQICGGSLISNNIVLSAAHCFWSVTESKQLPAADFAVALGKLYRPWNDGEDKDNAQRSNVKALHLPPLFQGSSSNYQEDIAVVVAATHFEFTTFVRPVCVDFDNFLQDTQLKVGNMGKVAGWGLTSANGTTSQDLKVIDLPFISTETCIKHAPIDFRGYITGDKFCAGFKNEHKAVCKGDSGGGLAFPEWESSQNEGTPRFYLRGVVSTAPTSSQLCNVDFYTTFTQIQRHEHFIKQFWENGGPCELKSHPSVEYRCLSFGNVESYWPCTVVSPRCRSPGYYSATALTLMTCVDGNWNYIAKCSREAPCKEESRDNNDQVRSPLNSMDSELLNHVTVKRDSAGLLTYFEMHFAIEADERMVIWLYDKVFPSASDIENYIFIGRDSNQYTHLTYQGRLAERVHTPDILSSTQFRTFYIIVDDGTLELGKEGDSNPIISHYNDRFRKLKYYGFQYYGNNTAKIRFDCPVPVLELS